MGTATRRRIKRRRTPAVAKKFEDERGGRRRAPLARGAAGPRVRDPRRQVGVQGGREDAGADGDAGEGDGGRGKAGEEVHLALCPSLKRRALLAWVLELDEATRRKRLLRKALARMRMRTLSDSFEGWLEFRRKAKEQRLERKVAELERRAAAAGQPRSRRRGTGTARGGRPRDKAAALAEAEAREAEARHEVATIRGEDAEPWSPASAATATPLGATTPASP